MRQRILNSAINLHIFFVLFTWAGATEASADPISGSLPSGEVKDTAEMLAPAARDRLTVRLQQFYGAGTPEGTARDDFNVQLHIYTLKAANGVSPDKTIESLYRDWRSLTGSGNYFEREVILFVFPRERQARFVAGNEISSFVKQAVQATRPALPSIFEGNAETALLGIIDQLAAGLHLPPGYHDAPPVPADPGPIFGKLFRNRDERESDHKLLVQTIENASREARHPIVLVQNPELNHFDPRERAEQLVAAWPGRTLLLLAYEPDGSSDLNVVLRPADAVKARFSKDTISRIEREIGEAAKDGGIDRTLTRTLGEIGAIAAGHPQAAWNPWKHPIQALLGGRDANSDKRLQVGVGAFFKLAALILLLAWIVFFIKDPRQATAGLVMFVIEVLLGGTGSGRGRRR